MTESYEHMMGEEIKAHNGPADRYLLNKMGRAGIDASRANTAESARKYDVDKYDASDENNSSALRQRAQDRVDDFGSKIMDSTSDTYTGWNRQI